MIYGSGSQLGALQPPGEPWAGFKGAQVWYGKKPPQPPRAEVSPEVGAGVGLPQVALQPPSCGLHAGAV